jgi:hypothetical protein
LHLPAGDLKEIFINENSYKYGVSGRSKYYNEEYIIFICTIYRLFGCEVDNRISSGFVERKRVKYSSTKFWTSE